MNIPIVNRFSYHKSPGDFAESYFRRTYFKNIGLGFRKLWRDKEGEKPDGFILNCKRERIAIAEIKLIQYNRRVGEGFHRLHTPQTVRQAMRKARQQLHAVKADLPKIIYLIRDDSFLKSRVLKIAIFGDLVTVFCGDEILFQGHSGFRNKTRSDNKFRNNDVSAVICFVPLQRGYKLWIYKNELATPIADVILDKSHCEELWSYDGTFLKRIQ